MLLQYESRLIVLMRDLKGLADEMIILDEPKSHEIFEAFVNKGSLGREFATN